MISKRFYQIFNVIFFLLFLSVVIGAFVANGSVIYRFNPWITLAVTLGILGIWFLLTKLFKHFHKINKKKELFFVCSVMLVIVIIQIIVGYYLMTIPRIWDFGEVYQQASRFALHDPNAALGYFYQFPNNFFLLYFLTAIFKVAHLFGITNFVGVGIGVNIFMITCAIICLYLVVRKLFGVKPAMMSLLITLFIVPLFCYVPIFYTDTLSILFPILTYLLYLYIDDTKKLMSRRNILLCIGIGILSILGLKMKMTCVIILIAILIDYCLHHKIKKTLSFTGIILGAMLISLIGYKGIEKVFVQLDENALKNKLPYTHWLMMATSVGHTGSDINYSYGSYNADDYKLTYTKTTPEEQSKLNLEVLKKRVTERGFVGNIDFYYHKLLYTWTDGTYYIPMVLSYGQYHPDNILVDTFHIGGKHLVLSAYFCEGVHIAMIALMCLSSILLLKKNTKKKIHLVYLAILGLTTFLMLWETRSRYLVNFIPIFLVACMPVIAELMKEQKCDEKKEDIPSI